VDSVRGCVFTIQWGTSTASQDAEGEVTATSDARPTRAAVEAVLVNYLGVIEQVPPKFSAIKVDGNRAYDLAREGEDFELKSREVTVHSASVIGMPDADHTVIHVTSGKGFYVRAMARDLAFDLECEGHISQLRRTRVGAFAAADAVPISALQEMTEKADLLAALRPLQSVLTGIPDLAISTADAANLHQGRTIMLMPHIVEAWRAARNRADEDDRLALATCKGTAIALGDVRAGHFEPVRVFNVREPQGV
jgi:tRNA pseudouridine55 synthase